MKNIDFMMSTLAVRGKGEKLREVPLREDLIKLIKECLRERSKHLFAESEFLLLSQRTPKMCRDAIATMFERIGMEVGISIYTHKFRHTFCSRLVHLRS